MRPVRGLPALWRGSLHPERRLALAASAALFLLIGGMALYQLRLAPDAPGLPSAGEPERQPAGGMSVQAGPGAADAVHATGASGAAQTADATPSTGDARSDGAAPAAGAAELLNTEAEPAFAWPLAGRPRVVMPFGAVDDGLGDYRLSDSLALEATPGQPVVAAARGRVALVEEHPVDGFVVVLDHGSGRQSRYAGLAEAAVVEGQTVAAGERIGRIGLPSPLRRELGPHLLFTLLVDDEPVDPLAYLEE